MGSEPWPIRRRIHGLSGALGTTPRLRATTSPLLRLRQVQKERGIPQVGMPHLAAAWMMRGGSGVPAGTQVTTKTSGASHGGALSGQSPGTGFGGQGLATTWTPAGTAATGVRAHTGARSDRDYGVRLGLHGTTALARAKDTDPEEFVLEKNATLDFYDLPRDRAPRRPCLRRPLRLGRLRRQDRPRTRRAKVEKGHLRGSASRSSPESSGATWTWAPRRGAT